MERDKMDMVTPIFLSDGVSGARTRIHNGYAELLNLTQGRPKEVAVLQDKVVELCKLIASRAGIKDEWKSLLPFPYEKVQQ